MADLIVPDDFRAFMKHVVAYLDNPDPDKFLDAEDALQHECGYGGRIDHHDTYVFSFITSDGQHRWALTLREAQIRDIADGILIEIEGDRFDIVRTKRREPTGHPLLIWGEYGDDALLVHGEHELFAALDTLHASATESARMMRLWSAADDQVVAVVWGDLCALYVVESVEGYATSNGDLGRTDSFEVLDHDGKPMSVPYADCVPWLIGRPALWWFLEHGDLGPAVRVEGRIPSVLLMLGDVDRKAALAVRSEPPRELTRSSLPRMAVPVLDETFAESTNPVDIQPLLTSEDLAAWARRLVELLSARELIELSEGPNLDEISYQLGGLLQAHGNEAEDSIETADWLANEIGAVSGISKLFATGGDLQLALRRSREA
ncbi:MAG TPA: hypothetical protein VIU61_02645 [Kofleriaceae bacterium]